MERKILKRISTSVVVIIFLVILSGTSAATYIAATYTSTNGSTGGPWCTVPDGGQWIDFTQTITKNNVDYFGWEPMYVKKIYHTDAVELVITAPKELGVAPENFDVVFDTDCDGTPNFLVHWYYDMSKDPTTDSHWTYKMRDGGWSGNLELPDWIEASPETTPNKVFSITIDNEELEGCDSCFRYAVILQGSDEGYLGGNCGGTLWVFSPDSEALANSNFFGESTEYHQQIVDCPPPPVPVLTPVGLIILAVSLGLITAVMIRRR